jgi:hypothetical protein
MVKFAHRTLNTRYRSHLRWERILVLRSNRFTKAAIGLVFIEISLVESPAASSK